MAVMVPILAGLAAGLLSGWGIGGGTLLLVYLTGVAGLEATAAKGINLLFFLFAAGAALCVRLSRQAVRFLPVFAVILAGMIGVIPGTLAAGILPEKWIRILFGIMLITAGARSLVGIVIKRKQKNEKSV